jgi:hypothetical protein
MKYSRLVKLAQDTQTPQMHKQAAPPAGTSQSPQALAPFPGWQGTRWRGLLERATRRPSALAPAQGRQERGSAGAGLGYVGSAYGNQIAGGIKGQLAEYAPARLAGASNKKALGIGAGAGAAGAGLGYAGSAYGNQIAGGIKGQPARALARFRKGESPYTLKPEDNKTPIGEHPRNKTPYTKKNLTKPERSPATTPVRDYPGYVYVYETPAARLTEALRKILQAPPVNTLADYNKAINNHYRQIRADQEKASKTTPQPQGSGPSDHLQGFRSLGY